MDKYGELLGCGRSRVVFAHKDNPDIAVKIIHRYCEPEANRLEWEIWERSSANMKKLLVPCLWISDDGMVLHQARGNPATAKPARYPKCLTDTKLKNWVTINGRTLFCDYARDSILMAIK